MLLKQVLSVHSNRPDRGVITSMHTSKRLFRCVLASLYEGLSVGPSISLSVRPSVGQSKTREINIFEQNIVIGGTSGPLDASSQLYKTVYRSIGLSVH